MTVFEINTVYGGVARSKSLITDLMLSSQQTAVLLQEAQGGLSTYVRVGHGGME
jgi:hypothetical protein